MIKLNWNFEYDANKKPSYKYLHNYYGNKLIREINSILAKHFADASMKTNIS